MSDSICPSISQGFANWVVFLSLLPNNAVQVGAIALSAIVTAVHLVNACRAMSLDGRIEITLRNVEADVQDAIKHHILRESDACGDSTVESSLKTYVANLLETFPAPTLNPVRILVSSFEQPSFEE
jgi:hypothetical protein